MQSVNPATGAVIQEYTPHTQADITLMLARAQDCFLLWRDTSFEERAAKLQKAGALLRERKPELAALMADEMGKVLKDGESEIEKCALACDHYAVHAQAMLADVIIPTEARASFVTYRPLGVILAIMPWNFPFWQVFRFTAPNLMAGNVGILKHASNVCGCALAIQQLLRDAGFPEGCFTTLLVPGDEVEKLIEHPYIAAVTLTGSALAGRAVAAKAGACLKKSVLELGGSDPYVVLPDADIAQAAQECARSRLTNVGQSCIAAKRFIVVSSVLEAFEKHFVDSFRAIRMGDPKDPATQIGPMARADLRDALHDQVRGSITLGARLLLGGEIPKQPGAYYPPTVLTHVKPGMPAFDEELFGPVAAIVAAANEEEAFGLANLSSFGLGSALFTSDLSRAWNLAKTSFDAGQTFVNTLVHSDPRLPFGGIKESGYGRELGTMGIREFVNAKTVYIA
jgi:succinate-semialdehyde dehydrogenase/glutarate-semialdehyde dehydrogenase